MSQSNWLEIERKLYPAQSNMKDGYTTHAYPLWQILSDPMEQYQDEQIVRVSTTNLSPRFSFETRRLIRRFGLSLTQGFSRISYFGMVMLKQVFQTEQIKNASVKFWDTSTFETEDEDATWLSSGLDLRIGGPHKMSKIHMPSTLAGELSEIADAIGTNSSQLSPYLVFCVLNYSASAQPKDTLVSSAKRIVHTSARKINRRIMALNDETKIRIKK